MKENQNPLPKSKTREYKVWINAMSLCFSPSKRRRASVPTICSRWADSFDDFISDMGPMPSPQSRLFRKDKTLPYCKDNCIWRSPDDVYPDITGQKFGRWTVVEKWAKSKTPREWLCVWLCVCDCGKTGKVRFSNLTKGYSKSCGCGRPGGKCNLTHGQTGTAEYYVWVVAKSQINLRGPLGERRRSQGIVMCDEWADSFETFLKDMGERPHAKSRLTRRDKSLGFSKDNCYWSLPKTHPLKAGS